MGLRTFEERGRESLTTVCVIIPGEECNGDEVV